MALLNIRGEWYLYIWIIYRKIYSAFIWLFGNHCRVDKGRALISAGVARQSIGGLHRVRTRRRRQQHRKHVVALVRRPSVRRIVMAPGATAHAMMEDKEKILSNGMSYTKNITKEKCIYIRIALKRLCCDSQWSFIIRTSFLFICAKLSVCFTYCCIYIFYTNKKKALTKQLSEHYTGEIFFHTNQPSLRSFQ